MNQNNQNKSISIKKLAEQYDGFKHGCIKEYIANAYEGDFIYELTRACINRMKNRK